MRDDVVLLINDQRVEHFLSYRIESDLFVADDAFEIGFANPQVTVSPGMPCKLLVGGALVLTGVIDAVESAYDKAGRTLTVRGRDLMGLLTDSYVQEGFGDQEKLSLQALAEKLLAPVPFINRKQIVFDEGSADRAVRLTEEPEDQEYTQIQPGRTVFEVLKEYALAEGKLFFSLPDGTFVFGEPVTRGKAEFFLITSQHHGQANNVLDGRLVNDISRRYSQVTVIDANPDQGDSFTDETDHYVSATVEDNVYPFRKPFVATSENGREPGKYARILMDKQRFEGWQLEYKVPGHSQHGKPYTTNAACHVDDDVLGIAGDFLIFGRVLELSKDQGPTTTLKLSKLGVLPA